MSGDRAPGQWPAHNYGLRGDALTVCKLAAEKHPWAQVTSGKRTRESQAAAMAENEARAPGWIAATYVDSAPKRALLDCLRTLRITRPVKASLLAAFLVVLEGFSDDELSALTLHLAGRAFDLQPEHVDGVLTPRAVALAAFLAAEAKARGGKFLDREGGLLRFHWQARRGS